MDASQAETEAREIHDDGSGGDTLVLADGATIPSEITTTGMELTVYV